MLVTVTNASAATINDLDVHPGGSLAVGGGRKTPLPYPFAHIGALAAAGTKQLPMHSADWRKPGTMESSPLTPGEEWNQLVQAGIVTLAVAAQADARDNEDLFLNAV